MPEPSGCAETSADLGEPLVGSASQARRWVLVEQPGAWGPDAIASSGIDPATSAGLVGAAAEVGARLVLIRRHGRSAPGPRTAFVVSATPATRRIERFAFDDPGELIGLDLAPLADFQRIGGTDHERPLHLVCTHGSHDTCCARFGRPVAKAMSAAHPDTTWEVSHVGGDRFAANVVILPDAIYYGRVTPEVAPRLADAHATGHLDLTHLRGRSFHSFPTQVADHAVRAHLGLTGIDATTVRGVHADGSTITAVITTADAQATVVLDRRAGAPQQLTCSASRLHRPPRFSVRSIDVT